jgi:hypothetical protein
MGDRSRLLRSMEPAALTTPDKSGGWPQGDKPRGDSDIEVRENKTTSNEGCLVVGVEVFKS